MAKITNEKETLIYVKKRRRINRMKRRLAFLTVVLAAILCVVFFTPIFDIDEIFISGNIITSNEEILNVAGVSVGDNIFLTNIKNTKEILEQIPNVRNVTITRSLKTPMNGNTVGAWGNCSLTIVIEEEKPFVYIISEIGYIYLNIEGRVLEVCDAPKADVSLEFVIQSQTDFQVGENYFKNDENNLKKYIAIVKEIEDNNILEDVRDIIIDANGDINIHIKSLKVMFGTAENLDYKMNMVIQAMAELGENPRGTLDVTRGSKIYYSTNTD